MATTIDQLAALIGAHLVRTVIPDDVTHDESLGVTPVEPIAVVTPETAEHVSAVLAYCSDNGVPVTARGSGTRRTRPVVSRAAR